MRLATANLKQYRPAGCVPESWLLYKTNRWDVTAKESFKKYVAGIRHELAVALYLIDKLLLLLSLNNDNMKVYYDPGVLNSAGSSAWLLSSL